MNSVLLAVAIMLVLALARVHVVLALLLGALAGGLVAGLGIDGTFVAFKEGLGAGAGIALNYALLGAFAMAVANSGLPQLLADRLIASLGKGDDEAARAKAAVWTKAAMIAGILAMAIMSQNLIPVHIAFIPLLIPPLLPVMNKLRLDRRLVTTALTFGLVTTYMYLPFGFGKIFLEDILLGNIEKAGLDTSSINVMEAMGIPALGMFGGLLIAIFISYRKPRQYEEIAIVDKQPEKQISKHKVAVAGLAIVVTFAVQLILTALESEADALLVGVLSGLAIFMIAGGVKWRESDDIFTQGMQMMALIGFIMISAQGFASVMNATGDVPALVDATAGMFGGSKVFAALAMLIVGLIVTMGIGSSFSTLPIITTIYVPLCAALGFSPLATVALIGTSGALGDAGSPASDSTLGPTAGLNADGQHDHMRDSVIPTFLHFNIPLMLAGWAAALVL